MVPNSPCGLEIQILVQEELAEAAARDAERQAMDEASFSRRRSLRDVQSIRGLLPNPSDCHYLSLWLQNSNPEVQ